MTNWNDGQIHGWNGGDCPVHPDSREVCGGKGMSGEELIARLRDGCNLQQRDGERAAKRIEDLVERNKELALQLLATQGQAADRIEALIAERDALFRRATLAEEWRDHDKTRAETAEAKLAECEARLRKAVKALNNAAIQLDWCQTAREISKEIDATLAEIKSGVATTPYGLERESQ